jgi:hypothetical protein
MLRDFVEVAAMFKATLVTRTGHSALSCAILACDVVYVAPNLRLRKHVVGRPRRLVGQKCHNAPGWLQLSVNVHLGVKWAYHDVDTQ